MERPQRIIEIPLPRTRTLLTYRARGCRGNASPLRSSARTFRTIRTIRTARTTHDRVRVKENCVFQAVREVFLRFVGAVTRTFPSLFRRFVGAVTRTHTTVPPVRWCRHPHTHHRSTGSPVLHPATIPPFVRIVRSVRIVLTATAPFHRFFGAVTRTFPHRSPGSLVPSPALSPSHRSFSLAFFLK